MSRINLEGILPDTDKEQTTFSVEGAREISIEELVESIRDKIQHIHQKNARENTNR